jgi:hypothetical protein
MGDPNRANFVKKNSAPRLGVEMDFARNVETLLSMVKSKEYAVFFIAPGMCSLHPQISHRRLRALLKCPNKVHANKRSRVFFSFP